MLGQPVLCCMRVCAMMRLACCCAEWRGAPARSLCGRVGGVGLLLLVGRVAGAASSPVGSSWNGVEAVG